MKQLHPPVGFAPGQRSSRWASRFSFIALPAGEVAMLVAFRQFESFESRFGPGPRCLLSEFGPRLQRNRTSLPNEINDLVVYS